VPQQILLVADVHEDKLEEKEIRQTVKGATVNAVLFLGDVSSKVMEFCRSRFYTAYFWGAIKGNHDDKSPFPSFITPLHLRKETCGTLTIAGIDGCLSYKPVGHFLWNETQMFEMLQNLEDVDILITHGPPSIHAKDDGVHFGSECLTKFLLDRHCRYLLHGHNHQDLATPVGPPDNPTYAIGAKKLKLIRI
jgi:Icc-related predicted phosphoesterase